MQMGVTCRGGRWGGRGGDTQDTTARRAKAEPKPKKKLGMKFNDFRKQINLAICKPFVLHMLSGLFPLVYSLEVNFAVLSIHSSSHHGVLGEANHGVGVGGA